MSRILVTGASGFIGKHLVRRLTREGHAVVEFSSKDGDISERDALSGYDNVEHVFHLAAKTFVPESWSNPHDYFRINILGMVTVLEFCRRIGASLTLLSTYVYGEPQYLPVNEEHPLVAASPYHQSKIMAEELAEFYSKQFNVKTTVLRIFNVYGQGQSSHFLIPKIYAQVVDDTVREVSVMDLEPRRDYVYIDDVTSAMLATLNPNELYRVYNVGSGAAASVRDVIETIFEVTGIQKPIHSANLVRKSEVSVCVADTSRIRKELSFVPLYTLYQGLKAWHEML
ncbi:NAD-dependent epimerase/dehydratase family protein [Alicyclobacillus mengziensis]|uniref:NAD(P)-dependent oxidoreductase n=1 Tax=Alicyclobacillus mengziensis TaxID=2931921 RepID=A0A9X7Z7M8_9BACL|nr:NAD(P)-dependent oxidoreductase [Alicyclobacillus mengziensis]QSO47525.1 NAD(P)-dependent oxidoreductase [Alicyclobacillus mengziensis]